MSSKIARGAALLGVLTGLVFGYQNCGSAPAGSTNGTLQNINEDHSNHTDHSSHTEIPAAVSPTPIPDGHNHVHTLTIPKAYAGAVTKVTTGDFTMLADGKLQNLKIAGRTVMIVWPTKTRVDIGVVGLAPNSHYGAHVHSLPCAQGAGAHYKIDATIADALEANEIWPAIASDASGVGYGSVVVNHEARADAVSVVIHGSGGVKVACADLAENAHGTVDSGEFAQLTAAGAGIAGRALLARRIGGYTEVRASVKGLPADTNIAAHVHSLTCAESAGGHYKIDTSVMGTVLANEIWPTMAANSVGMAFPDTFVLHTARSDAKSVVIHSVQGAKISCADLVPFAGGFLPTDKGLERNMKIAGTAVLTRSAGANGGTTVDLNITGLAPNKAYTTHVHNRPCALGAGGHYKIDETITAVSETNEIWNKFTTNLSGIGTSTTVSLHTARPDAVSVVIHDSDGQKIACADLY